MGWLALLYRTGIGAAHSKSFGLHGRSSVVLLYHLLLPWLVSFGAWRRRKLPSWHACCDWGTHSMIVCHLQRLLFYQVSICAKSTGCFMLYGRSCGCALGCSCAAKTGLCHGPRMGPLHKCPALACLLFLHTAVGERLWVIDGAAGFAWALQAYQQAAGKPSTSLVWHIPVGSGLAKALTMPPGPDGHACGSSATSRTKTAQLHASTSEAWPKCIPIDAGGGSTHAVPAAAGPHCTF